MTLPHCRRAGARSAKGGLPAAAAAAAAAVARPPPAAGGPARRECRSSRTG